MSNAVIPGKKIKAVILSEAPKHSAGAKSKNPEGIELAHIAQPFSTMNSTTHHSALVSGRTSQ